MRSRSPDNGLKPLPKERRHAADYRDELEHEAVARILAELPPDHIAVYAYSTAARSAADTISLTHLLADRMDLVERLVDAVTDADRRRARGIQETLPAATSGRTKRGRKRR